MEGRIPARLSSDAAPEPYSGGVRGVFRRHLMPLICLGVAGVAGFAAVLDHHWKESRAHNAEVREWYCAHLGKRCAGPSSATIERHWNERELAYETLVVILGGGSLGWSAILESRRRR